MITADYIAIGVMIVLVVWAVATQFPVRSSTSRVAQQTKAKAGGHGGRDKTN